MNHTVKLLRISLVFSFLLILGCQNAYPTTTKSNELAYSNSAYNFSISYPKTWSIEEDPNEFPLVSISQPKQSEDDQFIENINIITEDLNKNPLKLDDYTKLSINMLEKVITNYKFIELKDVMINGIPGKQIKYNGTQGQFDLTYQQILLLKDAKAYVVTFTGLASSFEENVNEAEKIMKSFVFN